MSDEKITLSLDDARHLFDLAIDTPLLCSGSFETDDVAVLRKLAVLIKVDPAAATPDEFVYDFPHPFKPFSINLERNQVPTGERRVPWPGAEPYPMLRPETDDEVYARLGESPDRCSAGSYSRRCRRPAADPIHTAEDERLSA